MPDATVLPFNQKIRLRALRLMALGLIPSAFVIHPILSETGAGEVLEMTGIGLVIAGVLGRFWSILYIGGHKDALVMDQGPYSVCRHPLYFFSSIAVLGFGIMLQSLVFAVLLTGLIFAVLSATAAREEAFLRSEFGDAYDAYARRTPRIIPDPPLFKTTDTIRVNVHSLRTNFFDALVLVAFIPVAESIEELREVFDIAGIWFY